MKIIIIVIISIILFLGSFFIFRIAPISVDASDSGSNIRYDIKNSDQMYIERLDDYTINIYKDINNYVTLKFVNMNKQTIDSFLEYHSVRNNKYSFINKSRCRVLSIIINKDKLEKDINLINAESIECHL